MAYRRKHKMSRFTRSQKAHERLWQKHNRYSDDRSRKLLNYHAECIRMQNKKGAVLTRKERKTVYNSAMIWG